MGVSDGTPGKYNTKKCTTYVNVRKTFSPLNVFTRILWFSKCHQKLFPDTPLTDWLL
jgi:hypothetical protein